MKKLHKVEEYEMERGYGQRHEGTYWFSTKEKAEEWCKRYNSSNVLSYVPDVYWVAMYKGEIEVPDEKDVIS